MNGRNAYEPPASAPARQRRRGALISQVDPGGPAMRAGLREGMLITHVNGVELRDMIDWQWEADGPVALVEGIAFPGTDREFEFECDLERDFGQDWGLTFDGAVFDGMRLCRNDCLFCFMKMLPRGMRRTLYMRDDDYRLSFLQGNFVTLTNLTDEDVERIIECALSPLNVSIHAVTPQVRRRLMGRNADRGIEALEQLLAGGIEVHGQIVLVRGVNDGEELERTLDYVEARPLITSLGIVPLGFTRHQDVFHDSFNDPDAAAAVIEAVRPYQLASRRRDGRTRYQLADEFYLSARVDPPCAADYDGYPQYYDGIGMVRSFLDEAEETLGDEDALATLRLLAQALGASGSRMGVASGVAAAPIVERFLDKSPLAGVSSAVPVENRYFGGNVDVTGLLTATDVLDQLADGEGGPRFLLLPELMFNDDRLTLDGMPADDLVQRLRQRGTDALVATTTPRGIVDAAGALLASVG